MIRHELFPTHAAKSGLHICNYGQISGDLSIIADGRGERVDRTQVLGDLSIITDIDMS